MDGVQMIRYQVHGLQELVWNFDSFFRRVEMRMDEYLRRADRIYSRSEELLEYARETIRALYVKERG